MSSSLVQIAKGQLAKLPEITALVVSDRAGALQACSGDCSADVDGEAAAAVYGVVVEALGSAGEQLGMGALLSAAIVGRGPTCVLGLHDQGVVAAYLDPSKPSNGVERKIELALRR